MIAVLRGGTAENRRVIANRMEDLCGTLLELGMSGSQARVMAALVQVGMADSVELAELSGVPCANTSSVMEALAGQGLAERVPSTGPPVWACDGGEAVLKALEARVRARMRRFQEQVEGRRRDW